MWLRVVEVWLTARLLQSPTFHRLVQTVHTKVRHVRHGKDPEEMGGTNIDKAVMDPNARGFLSHFMEEIKEQLKGGSPQKK